jgi:hypothetical protein
LLTLILVIAAGWVRAEEVRADVWPVGEWQSREGETSDVFLPGAGLTLETQFSNPGTSHTLFEGATGFVFYGGDGRTDQLPKRWERVVTLAGDSGEGGADYTSWTLALAAADATTPSLIQLLPDTYTLPGQVVLGPGVSLHGAGRTLSVVTCSTSGWYTPPDARTSGLIAKWGNGEIAHLTIQSARNVGYPGCALSAGYNGTGTTSGGSMLVEDCDILSVREDTLYTSGDVVPHPVGRHLLGDRQQHLGAGRRVAGGRLLDDGRRGSEFRGVHPDERRQQRQPGRASIFEQSGEAGRRRGV